MRVVAVSEVTRYLKDLLEEDYYLQDVWIRGEISNYVQAASGHRYFSLKDDYATLACVLWRGSAGHVPLLRNGVSVVAHGRFSVYEPRGNYQFYVDAIEDAGIGELHLRFEQLKARLEAEGLFAPERKRVLPPSPAVVGVVTSASAAAFRDILRTLRLRCPLVRVILAPALVQGDGAADQVANAIDVLNAHGAADVIIVARGGGSLEELWAFNEEAVARAIARSRVPVVTGVGHETDFSIADFVADLRASTPTAAAAAVVPDAAVWRESLSHTRERLDYLMGAQLQAMRERLRVTSHNLARSSPAQRINADRQRVDEARRALETHLRHALSLRQEHLRGSALRLHSLSPLVTLGRGFAVVRRESDGALVTSVAQVSAGQGLHVQVADGAFAAIAGPRLEHATPDAATTEPATAADGGALPDVRRRAARPVAAARRHAGADDTKE